MSATILSDVDKVGRAGALGKRAILIVVSKESLGKCLILEDSDQLYIIGRDREASLFIDDPKVSKHHCSVSSENGEFILTDNGSTNSTFLNSKPLKKSQVLSYGDRIIVGATVLRFFFEEQIQPQQK